MSKYLETLQKRLLGRYVNLYHRYNIPFNVHKLIIRDADTIEFTILLTRLFPEESLEARNINFRRYGEFYTRKFSRTQTMTYLLHALLYSSNPYISSISRKNNTAPSYKSY